MTDPVQHRQETYGLRDGAQDFPLMCVLSFVYVCNAHCPNCPYTNSNIREEYRDAPFMPGETFKKIADECASHKAWLRISGGGEPMLHPQAIPLLVYAKSVGAKVGLITNGSVFNEASIRALLEAQIDMVEFSVDAGDPETYDRVRKGLSWTQLTQNVGMFVRLRNQAKLSTRIIASGVNQKGVDIEQVETFWTPLVDTFQKRKFLTWSINKPEQSADSSAYLPPEENIPCPFIFERLNIDSRGRVMVCGYDIAARTNMGNINETSIQSIWRGKEFQFYRDMHLQNRGHEIPLCKECPDWKYRSWKHNYWKLIDKAEATKIKRFATLDFFDAEGHVVEEREAK